MNNDPRKASAHSARTGWTRGAMCIGAMAAFAAWALWPLPAIPVARIDIRADQAAGANDPGQAAMPELDLAAFRTPLWIAPSLPPDPPEATLAAAAPLPPLKLQLIAVVDRDGVYEAVLFDPDSNRLWTLLEGDTIGERTLCRVTADEVRIRDAQGERTLPLKRGLGGA